MVSVVFILELKGQVKIMDFFKNKNIRRALSGEIFVLPSDYRAGWKTKTNSRYGGLYPSKIRGGYEQ